MSRSTHNTSRTSRYREGLLRYMLEEFAEMEAALGDSKAPADARIRMRIARALRDDDRTMSDGEI